MPYIKETIIAGDVIEVRKYFSGRIGKRIHRSSRIGITSDAQRAVNDRMAERKLRGLINANFSAGDWHLQFTYAGEAPSKEQAREDLRKALREMRKIYRKNGKELKYITVTEYESKRIHHHLLLPKLNIGEIQKAWNHGMVRATALYANDDYHALAAYLIKETRRTYNAENALYRKRYNASRNLTKPTVIKETVKADTWREKPTAKKGYTIVTDSVEVYTDIFGRPAQSYRMIRLRGGGKDEKGDNLLLRLCLL